MLSYGELLDLCSLGTRLRYWTTAFPCYEDGLCLRVLRETWKFVLVDDIQAYPESLPPTASTRLRRSR